MVFPKFTGYFEEDYKRKVTKALNEVLDENDIKFSENDNIEFIGADNSLRRTEVHSGNDEFKIQIVNLISSNHDRILAH